MNYITVVYAIDENFVEPLKVSMGSILLNSSPE